MVETDRKRELIIEGAIKRFIHFGINKTTMNEIADDLSVSKPALYYYFPDKSSLILGVVEKIYDDYFHAITKEKAEHKTLQDLLPKLVEVGHKYFQKYYMLHLSGGAPDSSLYSPDLRNFLDKMKSKTLSFYVQIFEEAVKTGEIDAQDCNRTADLYMISQNGITSLCIMHGNKELFPGKKELKTMLEKQISLAKIFIKGIERS